MSMRYFTRRLFVTGVLFLLAPVWTFPFIDEITLSIVRQRLAGRNYGIIDFDLQRFPMEFDTFHYLYVIGVWTTLISIFLYGVLKLREAARKSRSEKSN